MRRLLPYILPFLLGLIVGKCLGAPSDEVRAAVADLRTVPQERWVATRYLSLATTPDKYREETVAVVGYTLNALSQAASIVEIKARGDLIPVPLDELRISTAAWEALVSNREPYFHSTVRVIDPTTKKVRTVYTDGGWVNLKTAEELRTMTGSGGAVVRADWFLFNALQPPDYYNMAGVPKKLSDLYALFGVNGQTQIALNANKGASIFRSGVTHHPRRISRWQTPRGAAWVTYDSRDDGDPLKHPIRVPGFGFKHDASEHILTKPNGLHLFALYNDKGERQNEVPPDIAHDTTAINNDKRLLAGISCIRCHEESGLRPFGNDFAKLLDGRETKGANLHLPIEEIDKLQSFYDTERLDILLKRDREDYEVATKRATGGKLDGAGVAKAVTFAYAKYGYDLVGIETALRDLGAESEEPLKQSDDPIVLAIVAGLEVNRSDWELSYGNAALLMEATK